MNANTWEVAVSEKGIELCRSADGLDEDDDLVELERIEQIVQLSVLGGFSELDVVLLQTVQGELGLVIDVNFKGLQMKGREKGQSAVLFLSI